ncbi:MAG: hypothetical protein N4A57_15270 [Anaeromicrobium sp.]|jgi:predicted tellurium resistance membrane protein TerC|uniref:hypothetical protein n=1 Tax=Anaeromicrobium sp. TaxID=1929132 RepID=UPI0025F2E58B|nr:hypothetical protein [Anaeromicrobium sp.]MCT4595607.1 hypothetical protein [Anaeromicrobium sp.]
MFALKYLHYFLLSIFVLIGAVIGIVKRMEFSVFVSRGLIFYIILFISSKYFANNMVKLKEKEPFGPLDMIEEYGEKE